MSASNKTPTHPNRLPDLPLEPAPIPADLTTLTADELRELIGRLQQRQAELEGKNELLRQTISHPQTRAQELATGLFREQDVAKSLIEMAQVIILVLDLDGKIVYFNPYMEQLSGFSLAEVQGQDWFTTFLPHREWYRLRKRFAQAISGNQAWENINPIVTKQAAEREIEWYDVTLKDDQGKVTGLLAIGHDITEQKQTQAALRDNEELFRQLAENIHEVFFVRDLERNRMVYVSPIYETVWGCSREELYQNPQAFLTIVHPEDKDRVVAALIRQNEKEYFNEEYRILRPDGVTRWIRARTFPIRDEAGRVFRLAGLAEDITGWKQTEAALQQTQQVLEQLVESRTANLQEANRLLQQQIEERKQIDAQLRLSEERLRAQFDGFPIPTYIWQYRGDKLILIDYNYAAELITKGGIVTYLGQTLTQMYGHLPEIQTDFWRCIREKIIIQREIDYRFLTTGETKVLNVHYVFVPPDLVMVHTEDITERKQAEEAIRQATDRYRQLFEEAPAMYVINRNENGVPIVVDCNELLLKTLGYSREEIVGQPGYKFYAPASRAELMAGGYQRALAGNFTAEERELVTRDGRIIETLIRAVPELDAQGQATGTRAMYIDISERKKLQRRLEAIYKLGQELTLLRDEASIIQRVFETAVDSLNFDLASCGLVEAETGQLHYRYGIPQPINLSLSLEGNRGISVEVARSGQALNIPDIEQDPRYVPMPEYPHARSELCVPLKIGVRVFGVLDVESIEPHRFTAADQQLLQLLADQAAVALENARLYSETRHQARELALINKVTRLMAASLDLQTVLKQSIIAVNPLLQTEGAAILLLDSDDQILVFECMDGPYPASLIGVRLPLSVGIVGWAARQAESALVNDVRQDPRFYPDIDGLTGLKTRSVLAVPLIFQQQVIGVIEVINKLDGSFTPHDLDILEALASSAAIAIKNARLYEAEQEQYRRLQQSQTQLIRVEKMAALGRLMASIAHEINNPIQAIQNCLALTKEELQEAQRPEKLHFYADIAKNELDRIAAMVRRMRDFYRPSQHTQAVPAIGTIDDFYRLSPQDLQPVDVRAILENVLLLANKQLQHNGIRVERFWSGDLPSIQANPDSLKQVFLNLILNAIDAMSPAGGTLILRVDLDRVELNFTHPEAVVRLEFQDTGQGISPENLIRLFEPLFTTKEHGTGFGLFTSYKIIEAHQGQIRAESRPGVGTTFTIYLPLYPDLNV